MVLDIVAANEKERLQHKHSLRMLQESNNQFAEQLQKMSTGFLEAMAKLSDAFEVLSASVEKPSKLAEPTSMALDAHRRPVPSERNSSVSLPQSPADAGTRRLNAIRQTVRCWFWHCNPCTPAPRV